MFLIQGECMRMRNGEKFLSRQHKQEKTYILWPHSFQNSNTHTLSHTDKDAQSRLMGGSQHVYKGFTRQRDGVPEGKIHSRSLQD